MHEIEIRRKIKENEENRDIINKKASEHQYIDFLIFSLGQVRRREREHQENKVSKKRKEGKGKQGEGWISSFSKKILQVIGYMCDFLTEV